MFGVPRFEVRDRTTRLKSPILSLSFTDDEYMSARNIESQHGFYAGAPREVRRAAPADARQAGPAH